MEIKNIDSKNYHKLNSMLFRKGFLYKNFNIKQIDCQNIQPTMEERERFLNVYNGYVKGDDGDSSQMGPEETRDFFMKNNAHQLHLGDKIYVKKGELKGIFGSIINFDDNGNQVVFKPHNLEGYDGDDLALEKEMVLKYFEIGDQCKIIDGRYVGETAMVVDVPKDDITTPSVKIDGQEERIIQLNVSNLQLITEKNRDNFQLLDGGDKGGSSHQK